MKNAHCGIAAAIAGVCWAGMALVCAGPLYLSPAQKLYSLDEELLRVCMWQLITGDNKEGQTLRLRSSGVMGRRSGGRTRDAHLRYLPCVHVYGRCQDPPWLSSGECRFLLAQYQVEPRSQKHLGRYVTGQFQKGA